MAHIMVVEDEPITAADLEQTLLGMGHELSGWADTGEDAVEQAKKLDPDLVLMDIRLRGEMTGIEAAERIRKHAEVPVVFLTAFADRDTVDRACKTHPYGYLVKPFTEHTVAAAVHAALSRAAHEQRTRERDRWVSSALRSMGEAVVAVDERGAIRFVNSVAEELLGRDEHELVGKDVNDFVRLSDPELAGDGNPLEIALREGRVTSSPGGTPLGRRKGPDLTVTYSAAPMLASRGQEGGAVLVFREGGRPEAADANWVGATESMKRRLQHEINSPLTYNLGALSLARRELDALRAMSALRDEATLAKANADEEERLHRLDRLLRAAHEGATRVASVMGELRVSSGPWLEAEPSALSPEEMLDLSPLTLGPAEAGPPVAQEGAAPRSSVLVVDDEPMIGRVLEITLQQEHDVTSVHSAESALALLERGDSFDVILCDLSMPGMGGRAFYETLRSTKPELAARVILMSGGAQTPEDERFLASMKARRLDKPFRTNELAPLIAERMEARGRGQLSS